MVAMGWQVVAQIWAVALLVAAVAFLALTKEDPAQEARRRVGRRAASGGDQMAVLRNLQVWRFALHYFFVFGAFVALALWLPRYLVGVYGLDVKTAGMLAAFYSVPASLCRVYGGTPSDRYGARSVLDWTFGVSAFCTFLLSYPPTTYVIEGVKGPITFRTSMGLVPFVVTIFTLGFFMSLGKASVFKHIPIYYPNHVGAVGGLVGMVGGLGGFVLPLAFGVLNDLTGMWTSSFALLFLLVSVAFVWMHVSVRRMEVAAARERRREAQLELPEMRGLGEPGVVPRPRRAGPIAAWRPEDPAFWEAEGRVVARRNLSISTYCLLLSFAVWMVWSVVVARPPEIGFDFTTDQLFWLAALPGLSGATPPIFGGRLRGRRGPAAAVAAQLRRGARERRGDRAGGHCAGRSSIIPRPTPTRPGARRRARSRSASCCSRRRGGSGWRPSPKRTRPAAPRARTTRWCARCSTMRSRPSCRTTPSAAVSSRRGASGSARPTCSRRRMC
jgi:NNP family nitrate/nitrite transporter-like MFS transporter